MNNRRVRFIVAYDGTYYHGFQTQDNPALPTIQDQLQLAIKTLTNEEVTITCAGRTDAGVHARGQVIDFATSSRIPDEKFHLAMNSLLPKDIAVINAVTVHDNFHSRFHALGKHYRYSIYNNTIPSPFHRYYTYQIYPKLNRDAMFAGARAFVGTHDFSAFCAAGTSVKNFVRTIWHCEITEPEEGIFQLDIMGNGFLYNMVRIIAGTLIDVGKGKIEPSQLERIIQSQKRALAGTTAPPQGLCLIKVWYNELDFPFTLS
ncbi:tRNA pseudouridine(38-40) synthase TruA [Heliorestis acidaminivorans]|uniref:tRNA pseudouridine synthase A n=1 Tax=Heliorestis acidaminivorans TaxID=553427 RepID=A0A6I0ENN0_9FIRM|nr:tRNA pseudouridine(38-40) synthase TruA [Heliorestis acidaminivorans]KAB2951387.1 tRNA pseudouridine(38-40) synthase TruA [Heliorestis acidaminivorans]